MAAHAAQGNGTGLCIQHRPAKRKRDAGPPQRGRTSLPTLLM
jgi:hypothetical protein